MGRKKCGEFSWRGLIPHIVLVVVSGLKADGWSRVWAMQYSGNVSQPMNTIKFPKPSDWCFSHTHFSMLSCGRNCLGKTCAATFSGCVLIWSFACLKVCGLSKCMDTRQQEFGLTSSPFPSSFARQRPDPSSLCQPSTSVYRFKSESCTRASHWLLHMVGLVS